MEGEQGDLVPLAHPVDEGAHRRLNLGQPLIGGVDVQGQDHVERLGVVLLHHEGCAGDRLALLAFLEETEIVVAQPLHRRAVRPGHGDVDCHLGEAPVVDARDGDVQRFALLCLGASPYTIRQARR